MNYNVKLINYAFEQNYDNVRLFDNRTSQRSFFNSQVGTTLNNINFIAGDLIHPTLTFLVENYINLKTLLNYNYAIIENMNNDDIFYFWINSSKQASGGQIICELEIDIFQTYFLDLTFTDNLITRAHLDRFKIVNNIIRANADLDSPLFVREDFHNVAKRLVMRERLKMIMAPDEEPESIYNNVFNNIAYWVYVYISPGSYQFNGDDHNTTVRADIPAITINGMSTGFSVLAYPVYKTNATGSIIFTTSAGGASVNYESLINFLSFNDNFSRVYSIKISYQPPFSNKPKEGTYTISPSLNITPSTSREGNGIYSIDDGSIFSTQRPILLFTSDDGAVLCVRNQNLTGLDLITNLQLPKTFFSKNEILQNSNSPDLNLKLRNSDYFGFEISSFGNSSGYDYLKLNNLTPEFLYFEALTPECTKINVVYKGMDEELYNDKLTKAYSGLICDSDNSLSFSTDQLSNYYSKNANSQSIQNLNIISKLINGVIGTTGSAFSSEFFGGPTNPVLAGIKSASSAVGTILDITQSSINYNLTIDNMRQAPNTLANANSQALLLSSIDDIGPYLNIYDLLPIQKAIINDYLNIYGYSFNKIDNIKNYINSRKVYNFIKAELTNIGGNVSTEIKNMFIRAFKNGVRFWHVDSVDFSLQNYEIIME